MKVRDEPTALLDAIGFWRAGGVLDLRGIREGRMPHLIPIRNRANVTRIAECLCDQGLNVYFGVAPRESGTSGRDGVRCSVACHADVDGVGPLEAFEGACATGLTPSAVVSSGGGTHLYWTLDTPCEDVRRVEIVNFKLARLLGADMACWDASRVLRLPGTKNYPCAKKVATGRKVALTTLDKTTPYVHEIATLEDWLSDIDEQPPERGARVQIGDPPPEPSRELVARLGLRMPPEPTDRSRADYRVAVDAIMRGATAEEAASIVWHAPWSKDRTLGYLSRTITNAADEARDALAAIASGDLP